MMQSQRYLDARERFENLSFPAKLWNATHDGLEIIMQILYLACLIVGFVNAMPIFGLDLSLIHI